MKNDLSARWKKATKRQRIKILIKEFAVSEKEANEIYDPNPNNLPDEIKQEFGGTVTSIHQYVVQKVGGRKQKVAVLVGRIDEEGVVRIGWSRANISDGDSFDKSYGLKLANARTNAEETVPLPPSLVGDAYDFQERCSRYFKNASGIYKIAIQNSVAQEKVED